MSDHLGVIQIDALNIPKNGVLVVTLSPNTPLKDVATLQKIVPAFFKGRKVIVVRSGDVKFSYISWEEEIVNA